jgi:small ligand-binding sensory domain FIST
VPFAAAVSEHPLAAHAVGEVAGQLLEALGEAPTMAVVFVTPQHADALGDMAEALDAVLRPGALVGCTASAIVAEDRGIEGHAALAVWAARLAGPVTPVHLRAERIDDAWVLDGLPDGIDADGALVLLADPYSFPVADAFGVMPGVDVIGGLASGAAGPGGNRLIVDGAVRTHGAVGLLIAPGDAPSTVVSQGCRPIGRPFTVTRADRNVLLELGGRPALDRLVDIVRDLPPEEQRLAAQGLHCGIVVDERKLDFERGDFLVRDVIGADRDRKAVGIGAVVPVGTTVQFHVRDASTAGEDLTHLLEADLVERGQPEGVLVFTCTGRGAAMFGSPHYDATTIRDCTGTVPVAGMFCAGELGPVAGRNALHGFTASLALFRDRGA